MVGRNQHGSWKKCRKCGLKWGFLENPRMSNPVVENEGQISSAAIRWRTMCLWVMVGKEIKRQTECFGSLLWVRHRIAQVSMETTEEPDSRK